MNDNLVERRSESTVLILFQQTQLDQLAHIRVNVFVVSTKLLRELPRVAAIVCRNKPNKLESFFRDGREQLPQAAKRKPRCRRAACFHLPPRIGEGLDRGLRPQDLDLYSPHFSHFQPARCAQSCLKSAISFSRDSNSYGNSSDARWQ